MKKKITLQVYHRTHCPLSMRRVHISKVHKFDDCGGEYFQTSWYFFATRDSKVDGNIVYEATKIMCFYRSE